MRPKWYAWLTDAAAQMNVQQQTDEVYKLLILVRIGIGCSVGRGTSGKRSAGWGSNYAREDFKVLSAPCLMVYSPLVAIRLRWGGTHTDSHDVELRTIELI